ncbi:MAG: Ig-like domain repeat protein, partial [Gemmataceae bacterium]|nr:Ig-like domain repeat protein [Gemmataceae bacterium]
PTGTVDFIIDGTTVASGVALDGFGQATYSTSTLTVTGSPHSVQVDYNGDSNFNTSVGTLTLGQTVQPANTTTAVSSSINPSVFGQSVTFTATVTAVAPGSGTPTGTVDFIIDGTTVASGVALDGFGQATYSTSTLTVTGSPHSVQVNYNGDSNFDTSVGTLTLGQTVQPANTTTTLTTSDPTTYYGQPVTFTATVAAVAPGAGNPTGTVNFFDGTTLIGSAPLVNVGGQMQASLTITTLGITPPTHNITAVYVGDANFNGSTSGVVLQTILNNMLAVGAGRGARPHVRVYDIPTGALLFSFFAYDPRYRGGVSVAVGDVNGDGVPDIVTAAGPRGGPHVIAWSGANLSILASFYAYAPRFLGGVRVAVGNFDADPAMEIVTGAGPGAGPHVRIFDIVGGQAVQLPGPLGSFYAFSPSFRGGITVTAGNFDGLPGDELIVGAGPGAGPHVRVFSQTGAVLASFFAFAPGFRGGVFVAAGDVNLDGRADLVVGAGPGAGPHVRVFDAGGLTELASYYAYAPTFAGGVRVTTADLNEDGRADIITGPGPGGQPDVREFDGLTLALLDSFFAFDPAFRGGIFVGSR